MIKGNGSNKRVDGGQRESFRATDAENSSRLAVRREADWLVIHRRMFAQRGL